MVHRRPRLPRYPAAYRGVQAPPVMVVFAVSGQVHGQAAGGDLDLWTRVSELTRISTGRPGLRRRGATSGT